MDVVIRKFGAEEPKYVQGSTGIMEFLLQKLKEALYCLEWPFLFILEKLKQGLMALVSFTQGALSWVGNAIWMPMHFVVDKLKEGFMAVENIGVDALAWLRNGFSVPLHFVVDKLKEGFIAVFGVEALAWLGKAFWVALPYMVAILVVVLLVYFWRIVWSVCFGGVRMMRAPGMACIRIPRALFEASPRVYFIIQRIILGIYRSVCALFRGLAALLCCFGRR